MAIQMRKQKKETVMYVKGASLVHVVDQGSPKAVSVDLLLEQILPEFIGSNYKLRFKYVPPKGALPGDPPDNMRLLQIEEVEMPETCVHCGTNGYRHELWLIVTEE